MARTKIDYGIDLGTTNSAIARMENGEPIIIKSDHLKDTMPSCVGFNKKQFVLAGDSAMNAYKSDKLKAIVSGVNATFNTFIEFKRTMGTDKSYNSSNMNRPYSSEELSSEVLKKLKSFVKEEDLKAVVVTVPAKFTINQKDATVRAASLAGFTHCELLQEPIAASMAYGLNAKNRDGLWLVFDFGGGTFDVALVRVEEGIMKVIDTEGDNYLGGKNIDYAIIDEIIIPHLDQRFEISSILSDPVKKGILREAMKYYAEEAKIQLSFKETHNILSDLGDIPGEDDAGNELELDITLSQTDIAKTIGPIFQKAINLCKQLLERNNILGRKLDALILVGGPTYSPVLRSMLKEQITDKVDTRIDPMTAVAKGAALFASTLSVSDEIKEQNRDSTKIQLDLNYAPTTVETDEYVTLKVLPDKTTGQIPNQLFAEIARTDKAWSSNNVPISQAGEIIDIKLVEGRANAFTVTLYDGLGNRIPCEPSEFTIIQGFSGGQATLPLSMGFEIKDKRSGKAVFNLVPGLEKNQTLPATGTQTGLKSQKQIRPGLREDFIKIPIYQGDYYAEGSKAIHNEHVYDAIITGEDLPALLPEGSEVNLTLKLDRSEKMVFIAHFPILDYSVEIEVPRDTVQEGISGTLLQSKIAEAKRILAEIQDDGLVDDEDELEKLSAEFLEYEKMLAETSIDYDRNKQILNNLRISLRKLEDIQDAGEWPRKEQELKESFYDLEELYETVKGTLQGLNEERIDQAIADFRVQIPKVIQEKNIKVAEEIIDQISSLDFVLRDTALGVKMEIGNLQRFHQHFESYTWKNPTKARTLINQGLQLAANNPTKQQLRPLIIEIFNLIPDEQKVGVDNSLLEKN